MLHIVIIFAASLLQTCQKNEYFRFKKTNDFLNTKFNFPTQFNLQYNPISVAY
jgi:hypothetical protein